MNRLLLTATVVVCMGCGAVYAQYGLNDLDNWILGENVPVAKEAELHSDACVSYTYLPLGTSPFYYEVMEEGAGAVTMWIHDPGNCVDSTNPGYPDLGPMWGLQTSGYAAVCVGIGRASYAAGCQGYSPWSTVAPYAYTWFKDGVRASHNNAFSPGWFKWTVAGGWDDITFTLHDVTYEIADGPPHDDDIFGDCTITYDATHIGGAWEAVFGDGWIALYLRGDGFDGVEDISVNFVSASGVFADFYIMPPPCILVDSGVVIMSDPARYVAAGAVYAEKLSHAARASFTCGCNDIFMGYSLLEGPDGMVVDECEGTIRWATDQGDIGDHTVSITALNGCSYLDTLTYVLQVGDGSGIHTLSRNSTGAPDISEGALLDIRGNTVRGRLQTHGIYLQAGPDGVLRKRMVLE